MMVSSLLDNEMKTQNYTNVLRYMLFITAVICGTVLLHDGVSQSNAVSTMNEVNIGSGIFIFFCYMRDSPCNSTARYVKIFT